MKRLALLVLLIVVVAGCGGSSSSARLGADDVAVAGETAVSKEKFQAVMDRIKKSYEANKRPVPKPGSAEWEQLKGQAVTFLVVRAEFEQELENLGGEVTDEDVEKEIEKLKKQYYGNDDKRYEQALKTQGLTEENAKGEVRANLVAQRLYNKVTEDVTVSDEEIKEYYDTHKSQYVQPQSREVRHILVEKKALADQLYTQLKSGGNFAALAKKYSKDPGSAQNGGRLTVTKGQTVPEFDKTTFELKKNELSQPVKTQYGYHIIQALSDIKAESKTPLAKVEASIKQQLEKQQKDEAMTKWVEDTKKEYCDSKIKYQVGYQPNPDPMREREHHDVGLTLGRTLEELQDLTERLRRDCPWDREQTERTIVPHTIEEAYEVADAAIARDDARLADELGDLLFQVYFLALLLSERGAGDLETVARGIHEKLVRRHPHVFGEAEARTAGCVRERWEEIKRTDEEREGIFHHVPDSLPALLLARKVQQRAAAINFEYPDTAGALADLDDELRELKEALAEVGEAPPETEPDPHVFEEMGDVLFAAVNVARRLNVDPELALRAMAKRFVARVERAEIYAAEEGKEFATLGLTDQDRLFDRAKEEFE